MSHEPRTEARGSRPQGRDEAVRPLVASFQGLGPVHQPVGDESAHGTRAIRSGFSELVEKEARGADPYEDRGLSIGIVVVGILIGSFLVAHQAQ